MTLDTRPAFRIGHAAHSDWKTATEQALKSLGEKGGDGAPVGTLGFIYLTDAFSPYAAEMLALVKNHTGIADWVGSVGIGIVATGTEYLDEPAVALMTCALGAGSHAVFSGLDHLMRTLCHSASQHSRPKTRARKALSSCSLIIPAPAT